EPLDREAPRHLPGLLLLPSPRARPEPARPLPGAPLLADVRALLRRLRPEQLRSALRHAAARVLRAHGAARLRGAEALDLPGDGRLARSPARADERMVEGIDDHTYGRYPRIVARVKRITANLPEELLREAVGVTRKGITETLVEGLRLVRRARAYEKA